jgi:asparagine synthase (glutamine-hydrolysing)
MCGIAGIVTAGPIDSPALGRMADAMASRGPDGEGVWQGEGVGLAFRRLAIIDLHERSNQPLHLGDLHLVFNGEIYNYIELREELRLLGHRFVTDGDGEVLLHSWAQWGEAALERLNGMFAFALWDAAGRRLSLAVDRFAEKPLFYAQDAERLMFASSVWALRAADPSLGTPDPVATERFLALGKTPQLPATFYADIRRLPPAHLGVWTPRAGLEIRRWWEPRQVDVPRDPSAAAEQLGSLLTDSVSLRLRSDVPVGTSLSGGVDSSSILALTSRLSPGHDRHAFTATFPGFARDEWRFAEEAARAAGVGEHHAVVPAMAELFEDLPALVADQEEPFGSTSIYAQWRVMRRAREEGVVVLLDGQGADELFGGYDGIAGWALRSQGARAVLAGLMRDRRVAESLGVAYLSGRAPAALARRYRLRAASPYVDPEVARSAAAYEAEAHVDWSNGSSPLRRELLTQAFRTSLPHLCRFADKDSMAFSVEVRLPFLDPRVVEFALALPPELVWRAGTTKWLLRRAMRGLVPDLVLDRRDKIGYETPQERWFGSEAGRAAVAEILLDHDSRDAHTRREVERDLASGSWRDTAGIWRAVNVELWLAALRAAPAPVLVP